MNNTAGPTTFFERLAYRVGFAKLESRYPWLPHPLICWALGMIILDIFVLQVLKEVAGYRATFFINPVWVLLPLMALAASMVVVFLHRRYKTILDDIDVAARTTNPAQFETLVTQKLHISLYIIFIANSIYQLVIAAGVGTVTEIGGVAELIGVAVVLPLGYGIIFSEFLATYVGIMLCLPRMIRHSDFQLNFLDPESLGGLRPAGELMKLTYYFLVLGLILEAVQLYLPALISPLTQSPYPDPGLVTNILFTALWLLSIATMVYGLGQIHWFMKREKRKELKELDKAKRELVNHPFEVSQLEIIKQTEYEKVQIRIEHVTTTREYPTTFTMWVQLLIGLILPKVIQVIFSTL